jgi:hypothetical protein
MSQLYSDVVIFVQFDWHSRHSTNLTPEEVEKLSFLLAELVELLQALLKTSDFLLKTVKKSPEIPYFRTFQGNFHVNNFLNTFHGTSVTLKKFSRSVKCDLNIYKYAKYL